MTLSKNQKKSINKKCSSFKGESKSKCIANAKRQYKEAKAKNEQHGKNIDKIENTYEKEQNQIKNRQEELFENKKFKQNSFPKILHHIFLV